MSASTIIQIADIKAWLNPNPRVALPSDDDALFLRLSVGVSAATANYLQGPVAPATFTETYNGNGRSSLPLRKQPVIDVQSVAIGTSAITARVGLTGSGFVLDGNILSLGGGGGYGGGYGYSYGPSFGDAQIFCRGVQNVQVTYDAGYQTTDSVTVPASPFILSILALSLPWNADRGVAYASGAALVPVTTAPTIGQYQITADVNGRPQYVFAAADVNAALVITYGFTPPDMQLAMVQWAAERYTSRLRIGLNSQSPGPQQSASFSQLDMSASVRALLATFRKVTPS